MLSFQEYSVEQLQSLQAELNQQYSKAKSADLKLDMTRGKPCREQLDLSNELSTVLSDHNYLSAEGIDARNYGCPEGLAEMRALFADLLGTKQENVIASGNSSLNLMYDTVARAMLFALPGAARPWGKEEKIRFICPVPGYDRHFFLTNSFGIEMINVPMLPTGPDMDQVEALVAADPSIKGMWLVPVYSNPDGITTSAETCRRLAAMATAAPDFRLFWDNAYVVHHLYPDNQESVPDMIGLCAENGHPDRVFEFASASKITFAGAGVACVASSPNNLAWVRKQMMIQSIGPDKVNQLRHVRFLHNKAGVDAIMARHAAILRPKFEAALKILDERLSGTGCCCFNHPRGGYFISLFVIPGTAAEVVRLAGEAGVQLTPAGNPYPYGKDPEDSNIRLAPSFPTIPELETAVDVLCTCIQLAAVNKILMEK